MAEPSIMPERPPRPDATGRAALLAQLAEDVDRATKTAKNIWWWVGGLALLVLGLAAAVTWIGSVNRASGVAEASSGKLDAVQGQIESLKTQQNDMMKRLDDHIQDERLERSAMHDDVRTALLQTIRIAEKVHAPLEPLPKHEKPQP